MPIASRAARRSRPTEGAHDGPADRPDPSLRHLREALSLPKATEVDGALYFGVGQGTTVLVMPSAPGQLLVLAELAATAELGADDWASLAAAWSSRLDGETTGRPLVLDDVLWLSTHVETETDPAHWIARVRRFLRWADEVRLRSRHAPSPGLH